MYHFTFIPDIVNNRYNYILFIFFNYEQKQYYNYHLFLFNQQI